MRSFEQMHNDHLDPDRHQQTGDEERLSICCGATVLGEFDNVRDDLDASYGICSECRDHATFMTEKELEKYLSKREKDDSWDKWAGNHAGVDDDFPEHDTPQEQ